jgi:hypothetical protein
MIVSGSLGLQNRVAREGYSMHINLKADRNDSVLRDQVVAGDRFKDVALFVIFLGGRASGGTCGYPE